MAHNCGWRLWSRLWTHDIEHTAPNLFVIVFFHDADLYAVGTLTVQARVRDLTLYVRTQYVAVDKRLWSECLDATTQPAPMEAIKFFRGDLTLLPVVPMPPYNYVHSLRQFKRSCGANQSIEKTTNVPHGGSKGT